MPDRGCSVPAAPFSFYPELNAPEKFVANHKTGALLLKNRWNAVTPGVARRLWHSPWLIKHNLMGKERYPFPRSKEIGRSDSHEFVSTIGVTDKFGLPELLNGAGGSFCKSINQFHAPEITLTGWTFTVHGGREITKNLSACIIGNMARLAQCFN